MKKFILYPLLVTLALVAVSCDRKAEFRHETFVTLQTVNYSVSEVDGSIKVPVVVYNPVDDEVRVSVRLNSELYEGDEAYKNAIENKNFTLVSPASGVLTFAPGEEMKEIEIAIIHDPAQTGSRYFALSIESLDDAYNVGNLNTASFKIRDKEHPLEVFTGDWTGDLVDYSYGTTEVVTVTIIEDENDETYKKLKITGLDPMAATMAKVYSLKATVNEEKTKIIIASEQPIGYDESYASYFIFYGFTITQQGISLSDSVVMEYSADAETLTIKSAFGTLFTYSDGEEYIGTLYEPGLVLTKKK